MTIATGDVIRATARMTNSGAGEIQNVYYVEVTDTAGQNQLQIRAAIARYIDQIYVQIAAHMSIDTVANSIDLYNMTDDVGEPTELWPTFTGGGSASNGLPPQCSVMVRGTTSIKRREGRKYFPACTEGDQDNGIIDAAAVVSYNLAAALWVSDYTDASNNVALNPVVVRALPPLAFSALQNSILNTIIDTQRRRKFGVGI